MDVLEKLGGIGLGQIRAVHPVELHFRADVRAGVFEGLDDAGVAVAHRCVLADDPDRDGVLCPAQPGDVVVPRPSCSLFGSGVHAIGDAEQVDHGRIDAGTAQHLRHDVHAVAVVHGENAVHGDVAEQGDLLAHFLCYRC